MVGFGDWSARDPGGFFKGNEPAPVKKFKAALCHVCTVVEVKEYKTSALCAECSTPLVAFKGSLKQTKPVRFREAAGADGVTKLDLGPGNTPIHSVRVCQNCDMVVNRDVNAARNMRVMLECSVEGKARLAPFSQ